MRSFAAAVGVCAGMLSHLLAATFLFPALSSVSAQAAASGGSCNETCLFNTCDYWVAFDPEYTCGMLEANYSCDCSGCACFEAHDKCNANCFGSDCDEYVSLGYSCSDLEATYGCDCKGCDCRTAESVIPCNASAQCPSGQFCGSLNGLVTDSSQPLIGCIACNVGLSDTCASMGVSVDNCDTCQGCAVTNTSWIGDGFCDDQDGYNTEACNWDGGDCCASTCGVNATGPLPYECGANVDYTCHDPNAAGFSCTGTCLEYDCDYFTNEGYSCTELESAFGCDCSNCRGCLCEPTCQGYSCDYWNENHIGSTCEVMEADYRCDCTGCNCYVDANKCSTTCYGFSCDEWVASAGQSCSYLESALSCNCAGCECHDHASVDCTTSDDCPTNMFCAEFNRSNLTAHGCFHCFDVNNEKCSNQAVTPVDDCSASCSGCAVAKPSWVGDGICDDTKGYNTLVCSWDGGDCCESTCAGDDSSCGSAAPYHCLDASAFDYEGECAQSCVGETCNFWTRGGYSCEVLEDTYSCSCRGCASCGCEPTCNGYTCDHWNLLGVSCYELENAYGCDCSSCDSCAAEKNSDCDPTGCAGYSCDQWTLYHIGYSCESLESEYSCDCTGCICYDATSQCDSNCYGLSCDEWVEIGHTCSFAEDHFGCDCSGCACAEPTVSPQPCASSSECADYEYCANITANGTWYPVCSPCYDEDGQTCAGLGLSIDSCDKCAGCAVQHLEWLNDGYCDNTLIYNTLKCNWDGGDCCESTCREPADAVSWACGTDAPYACQDPAASDYESTCATDCFGETCDFWVTHGYLCEELEGVYGCNCDNCVDCGCGLCSGYSCHFWIEYLGLSCFNLENDYSCDCSGCDECANQKFSECKTTACTIGSQTFSCDAWSQYHIEYDCVNLENTYGCDCTGCECASDDNACPTNCFGMTCDDWVNVGHDCDSLETFDNCDCSGCECSSERGTGSRVECSTSGDCAAGFFCANFTDNAETGLYCSPCTDQDDNTCLSLGTSVDDCNKCTGCSVITQSYLGDGFCDINGGYNTNNCDWDGGDCCESTCQNSILFECGYQYACSDPNATDYSGSCKATCFGETCDYWVASQSYACGELESAFGCDCSTCESCSCPTCQGSSCAYWIHSVGYTCDELLADHGCDCSGCYDCAATRPCSNDCFGIPCVGWLSGGVTCADLDTTYGCNCAVCTGCSVPAPTTTTTPSGPFSSSTGPPTTTSNVDGAATNPDPETSSAGTIGGVVGALVAVVVIIVVIVVVVRKGRGKTRSISYNHRGSHHSRRAVTGLIDDGADGFGSPENNVGSYEGVTL